MKRYLVGNRLVKASDVVKTSKPEAKKVEKPVIAESIESELDELTVKELKKKAKELEIEIPKKAKKGELIDLIEAASDDSEL